MPSRKGKQDVHNRDSRKRGRRSGRALVFLRGPLPGDHRALAFLHPPPAKRPDGVQAPLPARHRGARGSGAGSGEQERHPGERRPPGAGPGTASSDGGTAPWRPREGGRHLPALRVPGGRRPHVNHPRVRRRGGPVHGASHGVAVRGRRLRRGP